MSATLALPDEAGLPFAAAADERGCRGEREWDCDYPKRGTQHHLRCVCRAFQQRDDQLVTVSQMDSVVGYDIAAAEIGQRIPRCPRTIRVTRSPWWSFGR